MSGESFVTRPRPDIEWAGECDASVFYNGVMYSVGWDTFAKEVVVTWQGRELLRMATFELAFQSIALGNIRP